MTAIYTDHAGDDLEVIFYPHSDGTDGYAYDEQLDSDMVSISGSSVCVPVNEIPELLLKLIKEAKLVATEQPVQEFWDDIVVRLDAYVEETFRLDKIRESYDDITKQVFGAARFEELRESNKELVRSLSTRVIGFSVVPIVPEEDKFTHLNVFPQRNDAVRAAISATQQLKSHSAYENVFKIVRVFA